MKDKNLKNWNIDKNTVKYSWKQWVVAACIQHGSCFLVWRSYLFSHALQNSSIIKTSPSELFFSKCFKLGNCLSNFLLSTSNYSGLHSVPLLLLRFRNNTVFWIPLFFPSPALSRTLVSQLKGVGWTQRYFLCLGRKIVIDIYQWLINSVAIVSL